MRKAVIQKEDIIIASIHQVYLEGLENFTPKKAAIACGISEGSVYHYFANKQDLLYHCMAYTLSKADESLRNISITDNNRKTLSYNLWNQYFRYYVEHREQALFHQAYRNSSYFNTEIRENLMSSFPYLQSQVALFELDQKIPVAIFWVFVVDTTLNFALRVAEGTLEDTPENTARFFELMIGGISGLIDFSKS